MVGISSFGDSTVDGNGTTPFSPNAYDASGNAIPNHYHNLEAPASWSSIIDGNLTPAGKRVFNNGYGGRAIIDGWAINNLSAAVTDNTTNTDLKFVMIDFGLNDVVLSSWSVSLFQSMYAQLILKVRKAGLIPVVLTSDPVSNNNERPTTLIQSVLVPAQRAVAGSNACMLCDKNAQILATWPEWNQNQPDGLHFNNLGHQKKAEIIQQFIISNFDESLIPKSPWASSTSGRFMI